MLPFPGRNSIQFGTHQSMASTNVQPESKESAKSLPTTCIVIGMAGSGKSSLMQRILSYSAENKLSPYSINLDPGIHELSYSANIDIRDTVNYKQVMKQYQLGPNGGILTSLNLFATRFHQVLAFAEKRAETLSHIFVDTPGQIEVFTWSASGTIISDSLASSFPTCLLYVIDTPRTQSPVTFMSNMLYACSILYKSKLPFILVFNKTDIVTHEFALKWMQDFEEFQAALRSNTTYMASLTRSMSLVLEEFYKTLKCVGVSAVTGQGMPELFAAIEGSRQEYYSEYKPSLLKKQAERAKQEQSMKEEQLKALQKDLKSSKGQKTVLNTQPLSRKGQENSADNLYDSAEEEEEEGPEEADEYDTELARERDKAEYEQFMQQLNSSAPAQEKKISSSEK
jgi:GTPase SAR1 family protein